MQVDPRRVQPNNDSEPGSGPVVYLMAREQRVFDNWALLYAQEQATKRQVPLIVMFALGPMFCSGTARHNAWMVGGLKEVEKTLQELNIPFCIEIGEWSEVIPRFVAQHEIGELVFDFNPLEPVRGWRDQVTQRVDCRVVEVDARNIIPVWEASDKAEFAAYTIRKKIHRKLPEFLTDIPQPSKQTFLWDVKHDIDWSKVESYREFAVDAVVPDTFTPGAQAGAAVLAEFLDQRLAGYATKRNDSNEDGVSHLSPYLRWGNISAQRVALEVRGYAGPGVTGEDRQAFLEELIVRRELTDNFVYYTPNYNKVEGAHAWAQKTIAEHAGDEREYIYTLEQFEAGQTHDDLWNAAQLQMVTEGTMHGYLRMYWAKKILEWTPDAHTAIDTALTLNDRYELDGRDSNGVVGVMWSICGVHDRAWNERPVFGKIRYMNYNGCKRKFDVDAYVSKYTVAQNTMFND